MKPVERIGSLPSTEKVYDMLVVGGGPGGTAAAFRGQELGLDVVVLDADDLMKRVRDYSKDKLILPNFGGGDKKRFPQGGEMLASLHFEPIDKDEMVKSWKALHRRFEIPSAVGMELLGLTARPDQIYEATAYDHERRCEVSWQARHVVLALGCGVPRRFDIPGDVEGIAFRLDDPAHYLGRPICVIGGGTTAAEAVIAISSMKINSDDPTPVHWSYRGSRLPRVSKALADVFFEAYLGNGNIRYHPLSEPMAIIQGNDHRDYLALRLDRKVIEGRPNESLLLEFPKTDCIACIGQDIPEHFLKGLGIEMVVAGARRRKRMVVNRYLETVKQGVYLVGDLLSQAYFETDDFQADPETFKEVKHRGNIKCAMRDGVLVAQVVAQRLKGVSPIDIHVAEVEESAKKPPRSVPQETNVTVPAPTVPAPTVPAQPKHSSQACLVQVLPSGVLSGEYLLERGTTTIGRKNCHIDFPGDELMADVHASVLQKVDGYYLRDEGSSGGVFFRIPGGANVPIPSESLIRLGRQFLFFEGDHGNYWFTHYDALGTAKGRHALREKTLVMGRQAELVLDPDDTALSRRHLACAVRKGHIVVKDLKAVNGNYLRLRGERKLVARDQFQVGRELFMFSNMSDAVMDQGDTTPIRRPIPVQKAAPATPQKATAPTAPQKTTDSAPKAAPIVSGEPSITFAGTGKTIAVKRGQTICEIAEEHGIALNAECHSGICGSDPIRVIAGLEFLDAPPTDQESETLEDICELEPGQCRLACMTKVKGPVTVEIMS